MAILFIIFIAIIGALFYGDSSLLVAILKFAGAAILIFGIMAIMAYCPWLLLVIIVLAIFVIKVCSDNNRSQSNDNKTVNNTTIETIKKINVEKPIDNPNLTGFKKELQENTLTPQQASDEQWESDKRCINYDVDKAYQDIKSNLLKQAHNGKYSILNGQRSLSYICEYKNTYSFFKRQDIKNPTGKEFTRSYNPHEKVVYSISDVRKYNYLMKTLKEKAQQDGINIDAYFVLCEQHDKRRINLPYTDSENLCYIRNAKMYLDCSIQY